MKRHRLPVVLLSLVALLLMAPRRADAWNGTTHRELARQAILWLLNSSNPELRLTGVAIVSAGEGFRADATGKRNWLLSQEAWNVDIYRDVLVRDKGDSPLPDLAYDLKGEGFTKYNHFLLVGENMSGISIERKLLRYPIKKGDPACSADPNRLTLGEGNNDFVLQWSGRLPFDVSCRSCEQVAQIYGETTGTSADKTECIIWLSRWMDQHSNEPGYVQGIDPTLMVEMDKDPVAASLRMVGSSEFQNFCEEGIEDYIRGEFDTTALGCTTGGILGCLVGKVFGNIPVIGDGIDKLVNTALAPIVAPLAANWLARKCPFAVGVFINDDPATWWEQFKHEQTDRIAMPSLAMIRLGSIIHSTIKPDMVQDVWLNDVRWHAVDQIGTWGALSFWNYKDAIQKSRDFLHSLSGISREATAFTSSQLHMLPKYTNTDSFTSIKYPWRIDGNDPNYDVEDLLKYLPRQHKGQLLHLGQLLHAMSDIAVAGHTTGHLLGPEHIALENTVDVRVKNQFDFTGDFTNTYDREHTSEPTGAVVVDPLREEHNVYGLDFLIDADLAQEMIGDAFSPSVLARVSTGTPEALIETIQEDAAFETRRNTRDRATAPFLAAPATKPELAREFATRGLVNNVVALVHAMRQYYGPAKFAEMAKKVTWTRDDAMILTKASEPKPTFGPVIERTLVNTDGAYSLYVDSHYQEYKLSGCFLRSRNWCDARLGEPCPDNANFCRPGLENNLCWTHGPMFVEPSEMVGWIVLSPENRGDIDDQIHVTGLFNESNVSNQMDKVYFQGSLNESTGKYVKLAPGVLAAGVATWCSGPDMRNEQEDKVCEYLGISWDTALYAPCDDLALAARERQKEFQRRLGQLRDKLKFLPRPPGPPIVKPGPLPIIPPGKLYSKAVAETISDLAARYGTSAIDLSDHLAPSQGKDVVLLDPSPYGKASFIWKDDKGLRKTTTILRDSDIVTTATAK